MFLHILLYFSMEYHTHTHRVFVLYLNQWFSCTFTYFYLFVIKSSSLLLCSTSRPKFHSRIFQPQPPSFSPSLPCRSLPTHFRWKINPLHSIFPSNPPPLPKFFDDSFQKHFSRVVIEVVPPLLFFYKKSVKKSYIN